jgi:ABC-2 type transport system permease protein
MNGSKNKASFRRIKALVVKEFYQVIRDPSSMMISIILPLVLLFIYGYGISLDMEHLKLGCLMEDRTPLAQSFAQSMTDTPFFEVKFEQNPTELTKNLVAGNTLGAVIIPSYFSDFSENAQKRGPIFVVADGSQPNSANFVQNYVMGAWENWQQQERISKGESPPPLAYIQSRFWYNEELNSHHFLIPGSIAIIMALIGTLLTALVIAREWERGTMEALMATPVTIFEIILGKLIPYFCLGLVSMVICTLVACFLFEVPLRGAFSFPRYVAFDFLCCQKSIHSCSNRACFRIFTSLYFIWVYFRDQQHAPLDPNGDAITSCSILCFLFADYFLGGERMEFGPLQFFCHAFLRHRYFYYYEI